MKRNIGIYLGKTSSTLKSNWGPLKRKRGGVDGGFRADLLLDGITPHNIREVR